MPWLVLATRWRVGSCVRSTAALLPTGRRHSCSRRLGTVGVWAQSPTPPLAERAAAAVLVLAALALTWLAALVLVVLTAPELAVALVAVVATALALPAFVVTALALAARGREAALGSRATDAHP